MGSASFFFLVATPVTLRFLRVSVPQIITARFLVNLESPWVRCSWCHFSSSTQIPPPRCTFREEPGQNISHVAVFVSLQIDINGKYWKQKTRRPTTWCYYASNKQHSEEILGEMLGVFILVAMSSTLACCNQPRVMHSAVKHKARTSLRVAECLGPLH